MKRVLNVGGNNKAIPLPPDYAEYDHVLLDIDPSGGPDIVCDARELETLDPDQFDAIYCSHNLEHYYRHDLPRVLAGFRHVLKPGGVACIIVPDIQAVMRNVIERGLSVHDTLYVSQMGPITALDMFYGYAEQIRTSNSDFFCHKNGFTPQTLTETLLGAGFVRVHSVITKFEIAAFAYT